MTVNTKQVSGRRSVRYESYDDLIADAERFAKGPTRTLGNWTPGQIYKHLAMGFDSSIDGFDFALPAPMRWLMKVLMKRKFITKAIPAGFKAPDKFVPGADTPVEASLAELKRAVERQKSESKRCGHPAFGTISRQEWDQFNLRHAEMHMSFLVEGDAHGG